MKDLEDSRKDINNLRTQIGACKTKFLDDFVEVTKEFANTNERIIGDLR
jgi:hypothetical protein